MPLCRVSAVCVERTFAYQRASRTMNIARNGANRQILCHPHLGICNAFGTACLYSAMPHAGGHLDTTADQGPSWQSELPFAWARTLKLQ